MITKPTNTKPATDEVLEGFEILDGTVKPRLVMLMQAMQKRGKTHFGLTMPGPIAFFNFDKGHEGVLEKFTDDKMILGNQYKAERNMTKELYEQHWEKLKTDYYRAMDSNLVRSILFDTGTDVYELLRWARFGKLSQVKPHHYGPVNLEFKNMIEEALGADKNVMFLHRVKDEYINEVNTGKKILAGPQWMPFEVQVVIEGFRWEEGDEGITETKFGIRILDSRHNPALNGMELRDDMCSFPYLATLVFPDSELGDWQ